MQVLFSETLQGLYRDAARVYLLKSQLEKKQESEIKTGFGGLGLPGF